MVHDSTRRSYLRYVGAASVGGLISGCIGGDSTGEGGSQDGDDGEMSLEELSEKAAEELSGNGKVNFTTNLDEEIITQMEEEDIFEGVYEPLNGNVETQVGGDPLITKYIREQKAGNPTIDIFAHSNQTQMVQDDAPFADLSNLPGWQNLPEQLQRSPKTGYHRLQMRGLSYNDDLVDEPPETYEDLLKPRFSDKKVVLDWTPNAIITGAVFERLGEDYVKDLKAQNPTMIQSGYGITQETAAGDHHVAFLSILKHVLQFQEENLPVKAVWNPDIWLWYARPLGVAAEAAHPNAAKLLANWWLTDERAAIGPPATVTPDFSKSNPPEIKEKLGVDEEEPKVWTLFDFDRSANDIISRFQELVDAPT